MKRWLKRFGLCLLVLTIVGAFIKWIQDGGRIQEVSAQGWYNTARHSAQILDNESNDAMVLVLAAPTYGWRGYFAVHPWILIREEGQSTIDRFEVVRWGGGTSVIRKNGTAPDAYWFGAKPEVLAKVTGKQAQKLIPSVRDAIESYPYHDYYRIYPGPNSNTFLAHIGRQVPELGLDLPPTAIGKDYHPLANWFTTAPSGKGMQLSLLGLLALTVSTEEGIELNVLGLGYGIDFNCPALRLPFAGRLEVPWVSYHLGCQP